MTIIMIKVVEDLPEILRGAAMVMELAARLTRVELLGQQEDLKDLADAVEKAETFSDLMIKNLDESLGHIMCSECAYKHCCDYVELFDSRAGRCELADDREKLKRLVRL